MPGTHVPVDLPCVGGLTIPSRGIKRDAAAVRKIQRRRKTRSIAFATFPEFINTLKRSQNRARINSSRVSLSIIRHALALLALIAFADAKSQARHSPDSPEFIYCNSVRDSLPMSAIPCARSLACSVYRDRGEHAERR